MGAKQLHACGLPFRSSNNGTNASCKNPLGIVCAEHVRRNGASYNGGTSIPIMMKAIMMVPMMMVMKAVVVMMMAMNVIAIVSSLLLMERISASCIGIAI